MLSMSSSVEGGQHGGVLSLEGERGAHRRYAFD